MVEVTRGRPTPVVEPRDPRTQPRRLRRRARTHRSTDPARAGDASPAPEVRGHRYGRRSRRTAPRHHRRHRRRPRHRHLERPRSTPPVRYLAEQLGVDLAAVAGTGADGLITRDDVQAVDACRPSQCAPTRSGSSLRRRAGLERRIPIKGVRKHTAAAMVRSAFTAPHATVFLTVDVTPTMELLARLSERRDLDGHARHAARPGGAGVRDRAARASRAEQPLGRRRAGDRHLRQRAPRHRGGDRPRA